eukprot:193990-Pelagomonas_calceolata.AAC.1
MNTGPALPVPISMKAINSEESPILSVKNLCALPGSQAGSQKTLKKRGPLFSSESLNFKLEPARMSRTSPYLLLTLN